MRALFFFLLFLNIRLVPSCEAAGAKLGKDFLCAHNSFNSVKSVFITLIEETDSEENESEENTSAGNSPSAFGNLLIGRFPVDCFAVTGIGNDSVKAFFLSGRFRLVFMCLMII